MINEGRESSIYSSSSTRNIALNNEIVDKEKFLFTKIFWLMKEKVRTELEHHHFKSTNELGEKPVN